MGPQKFDFQAAVDNYISQVEQQGMLSASDEAELRSHFLDSLESLGQSGLTDEESFVIASRRLGHPDEIGREYGKLSRPAGIQQIWAHLFLGFGLLTSVKWLYFVSYRILYKYVFLPVRDSWLHTVFFITFQLITCAALWSVLKWDKPFSAWLQKKGETRPWTVAILAMIIPVMMAAITPADLYSKIGINGTGYGFNNGIEEFSYYLMLISCLLVMLLSVFSISRTKPVTLSILYTNPSNTFILLSGLVAELLAITTRVLHLSISVFQPALFGIFYLVGSYFISYYNTKNTIRLLCWFTIPGLAVEIIGGIQVTNPSYPVYFAAAIVVSVLLGAVLGQLVSDRNRQKLSGY